MIAQRAAAMFLGLLIAGTVVSAEAQSPAHHPSAHRPSATSPSAVPTPPQRPPAPVEIAPSVSLRRSRPVVGLGARLLRRIRTAGPAARQRFLALGLPRSVIEAQGGVVTSELGSITSGELTGEALFKVASSARYIEAPTPLRPLLDVSRTAIGVDRLHDGRGFPAQYRGRGAIVAAYDSGVDLAHPDLRELGGPTRVLRLWDQTRSGTAPEGLQLGHECSKAELANGACESFDTIGHGTQVASVAAGSGPRYRGVAPEASLVIARSEDFEHLIDTLRWFDRVADEEGLPLVVNLSLGGHGGPHDGTSLECQAINALDHLVVAAAGNEGITPVHARVRVEGAPRHVALRFPFLAGIPEQKATVELWGPMGSQPSVRALVMEPDGTILAESSVATFGGEGVTEELRASDGRRFGRVELDPEARENPMNGRARIGVEVAVSDWRDAPTGPGLLVLEVGGQGQLDLWVDTPAAQPVPVSFDGEGALQLDSAVLGDVESSVSDIATAVSAVAVSAFVSRVAYPRPNGEEARTSGVLDAIASFSSRGPTLDPERTGEKPDLAAPGAVVVSARSRRDPEQEGLVSPLYRASTGTSLAAPHVAGTVALILGVSPTFPKSDLKKALLDSASREEASEIDTDARWGAGRLDARAAVELALGVEEGCACSEVPALASPDRGTSDAPPDTHWSWWCALAFGLALRGRGATRGVRP